MNPWLKLILIIAGLAFVLGFATRALADLLGNPSWLDGDTTAVASGVLAIFIGIYLVNGSPNSSDDSEVPSP